MAKAFRRSLAMTLGALATTALGGCYYGDVYGSSYASGGAHGNQGAGGGRGSCQYLGSKCPGGGKAGGNGGDGTAGVTGVNGVMGKVWWNQIDVSAYYSCGPALVRWP